MSLHPTLSEECIQYSIKKFFYAGLKAVDGVSLYFSYVFAMPSDNLSGISHDSWIRFHFDGMSSANGLAEFRLGAYVFSRGSESTSDIRLLGQIRDKLAAYLVNTDEDGNGIAAIPLLDISNNARVSSMVISVEKESKEEVADDKTLYRYLPIILKFATI